MKLYNSQTRKKENFVSLKENKVSIYSCGPTVYDYAHIGNFRTFLMSDLLTRVLKYSLNRWFNIIGGIAFTLIQAGTFVNGDFTIHYLFFSIVEVSTTIYIGWTAWNWRINQSSHSKLAGKK